MRKFYLSILFAKLLFVFPQLIHALPYDPVITLSAQSDVSCHGASDGSATFLLVAVGLDYYLVHNNDTIADGTTLLVGALNFTNLEAGDYTLIVVDKTPLLGGTSTHDFAINEPEPLLLNPIIQHVNCNNLLGSVDLNITGGSGGLGLLLNGILSNLNINVNEIIELEVGTHLLQLTDANGCEAAQEVTILEIPDPEIDLGADLNLGCLDFLDLQANVSGGGGSNSILWTTVDGNILNTVASTATISAPGTYIAEVTDINGCTSEDEVVVTANIELPVINLASQLNLGCLDSLNITASAGAGIQVNWQTTNGQINGSTTGPTIQVTAPGVYVATALNTLTGCESTKETEVTAEAILPSLNLGADVNLGCLSQLSLNASAGTGVEVSWLTSNGSIIGSTQGQSILIDAPGTYIAVGTNELGCQTTDEIVVTAELELPSINLGADVNLGCLPQIDLSANVGTGVNVNWLTLDGSILGSSSGANITINAPGTYLAVATNALGCQDSSEVVVYADVELPSINLGADVNLGCLPQIDLSANVGTGINVNWLTLDGSILGNSSSANITVNAPGTYLAVATNALGCQDTDQIVVHTEIDVPVIDLGADLEISCQENLTLVADLLNSLNIGVVWEALDGGLILGSNQGLSIDVGQPGTYVAVATNILTQCTATDTIQVTGDLGLLDIDLGADLTLGCGESLTIGATLPLGLDLLVQWSTLNGHIVGSVSGTEITVDLPGVYVASAVDQVLGCSVSDTIFVFGDNPIDLDLGQDTVIGCNDTLIIEPRSPQSLLNLEFQWMTDGGNIIGNLLGQQILITEPGIYTALVVDLTTGCAGSDTIVVVGSDLQVNLGPDQALDCEGQLTIQAEVSGGDSPTFNWQTPDGNIIGGTSSASILVDQPGTYSVTVTDLSGCTHSDIILVSGPPALSISGNAMVDISCGESLTATAQLTGGTDLDVDWWHDGNLIAESSSQLTISLPGTYVAIAVDPDGTCTLSDTLEVTGSNLTIRIEMDGSELCAEVQLNAVIAGVAGLTATWTTLDGTILASNINELLVSDPGIFIATVSDESGECIASDTFEVTDIGLTVNLGPDINLDCGTTHQSVVQTSGSPSTVIDWYTLEGALLEANSGAYTIAAPGTYVVTGFDPVSGCSGSDTLIVTGTSFTITLDPVSPLPCGGVVQLMATVSDPQDVVFIWSTVDGQIDGDASGAQIVVSSPGSYLVIAENVSTGCTALASVQVAQENDGPSISYSENQFFNCETGNLLNVEVDGTDDYVVTWSTADGVIGVIDGNTVLVEEPGIYRVVVVDTDSGCSSSATIIVFVNPECSGSGDPGGQDTVLTACLPYHFNPPSVDTNIVYTVTQVSGLCSGSIFPVGTTEIVFIISYETGDFDVVSWNVTVMPFEIQAEITEPSCFGGSDGEIQLLLPEEQGSYQLRWNDEIEQRGLVAMNLEAGAYTVSGLAAGGCIINQTFHLCQPDSLVLVTGLSISETDELSDGAINVTIAGGTAPYQFYWYRDSHLVSTEEDLYFVPAGDYTLEVIDSNGCSQTWTNLIIERVTDDEATSLIDRTNYPGDLVKYIQVYPNPAVEEISLNLELNRSAEIQVALFNQLGELIENSAPVFTDRQYYHFNLRNYVIGLYHMVVTIDGKSYVKKILVF